MKTRIAKQFTFDAAHFLPTVADDHKCRRMHGHTYVVELQFVGETAPNGFCAGIDYGDISEVWKALNDRLDHRLLNDVPGLAVPSTENLVAWIWNAFKLECSTRAPVLSESLSGVRVRESSTTWCELVLQTTPTPDEGVSEWQGE